MDNRQRMARALLIIGSVGTGLVTLLGIAAVARNRSRR